MRGIAEHDHGMKRCLRRFSDLLEEKDRAAKEHVPGLGNDEPSYTKSNKMIIHKSHCPNDHIDLDDPDRAPPTSAGVIAYLPTRFTYLFLCDANMGDR